MGEGVLGADGTEDPEEVEGMLYGPRSGGRELETFARGTSETTGGWARGGELLFSGTFFLTLGGRSRCGRSRRFGCAALSDSSSSFASFTPLSLSCLDCSFSAAHKRSNSS